MIGAPAPAETSTDSLQAELVAALNAAEAAMREAKWHVLTSPRSQVQAYCAVYFALEKAKGQP